MRQLGGDVIVLIGQGHAARPRRDASADTARVLSRYVDAIMLRTDRVSKLHELAEHATVPVINGLTEASHPCQFMADVLTFEEHRGPIAGQVVAWCGDGNNVARSWIEAAVRFGFTLRLATPDGLRPPEELVAWARAQGGRIELTDDAGGGGGRRALRGDRHLGVDVGRSEREPAQPAGAVPGDQRLMAKAAPDAMFMHCLPAHRGEEVDADVIDGPQSVVFDEAENRLHAQKGVLAWAMGAARSGGCGARHCPPKDGTRIFPPASYSQASYPPPASARPQTARTSGSFVPPPGARPALRRRKRNSLAGRPPVPVVTRRSPPPGPAGRSGGGNSACAAAGRPAPPPSAAIAAA